MKCAVKGTTKIIFPNWSAIRSSVCGAVEALRIAQILLISFITRNGVNIIIHNSVTN